MAVDSPTQVTHLLMELSLAKFQQVDLVAIIGVLCSLACSPNIHKATLVLSIWLVVISHLVVINLQVGGQDLSQDNHSTDCLPDTSHLGSSTLPQATTHHLDDSNDLALNLITITLTYI